MVGTPATAPLPEHADVVVVGSGMAGLACAALLAVEGRKVVLLEKHTKLGGYVQYFGKDPTWDSDHVLIGGGGDPASTGHLLHRLGVSERVTLETLDPAFRVVYPIDDLALPSADYDLAKLLSERFPQEKLAIAGFVEAMGRLGRAALTPSESASRELLRESEGLTAAGALDGAGVTEPRLRALLTSLWPLCGQPPGRLSAITFALWWNSFHGAGRPTYCLGGARALTQAFAEVIAERGGEVRLLSQVTRILVEEGAVRGVELEDGRRVLAPSVVANVSLHDLYTRLLSPECADERTREALDRWEVGPSGVVVHLHVEADAEGLSHTTLLMPSYDGDADFRKAMKESPGRSPLVMTIPTATDPGRLPEGQHLVAVMALASYARPDAWGNPDLTLRRSKAYKQIPEYVALKERIGEEILERCRGAYPGLLDRVLALRVATPLTMERYTLNTRGSCFGWAATPEQSRLPGQTTPVRGLYQCGHWTAPGGGVCAALKSGEWAATELIKLGG